MSKRWLVTTVAVVVLALVCACCDFVDAVDVHMMSRTRTEGTEEEDQRALSTLQRNSKWERCSRNRMCTSNSCRRYGKLGSGDRTGWCLAEKHSLAAGEICFRNNECESKRCFQVGRCNLVPDMPFCRDASYGVCTKEKGSVPKGQACYIDRECETKSCLGDVAIFRDFLRGKPSAQSVRRAPGHCVLGTNHMGKAAQFRHALLTWVLVKIEKDFARTLDTIKAVEAEKLPQYQGRVVGYYRLAADHHRVLPFESRFTGRLPHVRVRMPQSTPPTGTMMVHTAIGVVYGVDLPEPLRSVEAFNAMPEMQGEEPIVALEYLGPARTMGSQFAAVGIF